jgi:hypothetical protein
MLSLFFETGPHYVAQTGLELAMHQASLKLKILCLRLLVLQVYTTVPS